MKVADKIKSLGLRLREIENELAKLEGFRTTKNLQLFKRQLIGEKSFVTRQLEKLKSNDTTKEQNKQTRLSIANKNRSEKMKRSWRYFKSVQENYFPNMSVKVIRSKFKKAREGLETDIPDVAWRNPSP